MSRGRETRRFSLFTTGALALALAATALGGSPAEADGGRILDRRGRVLARDRGGERYYPHSGIAAHALVGIEKLLGSEVASGAEVVLTLDLALQKVAYRAVSGHAAAAVAVVEVETGRILALVSTPSFDPAVVTNPARHDERAELEGDERRPLLDRTVEQEYPPASTFKLVTAVAGLDTGAVRPDEEMTCTGRRMVGNEAFMDMGVHGTIHFIDALQHSCNVYFWMVGERVGVERLIQVARDFGFGASTGLGINGDLAGNLPRGSGDLRSVLNLAIGDGKTRATVLQVAMAYAALANGGRLYQPQLVRRVKRAGASAEDRAPILRRRLEASPATLDVIRRGLWLAVNRHGGTGFAAKKGVVKMVGKTGTAPQRTQAEVSHAWFAGWAPAGRPRIAIVVLIENGGVGGAVAAPVARDIIDAYFARAARQSARAKAKRAAKEKAKAKQAALAKLAAKAKAKLVAKRAKGRSAPVKHRKAKQPEDKRRRR